MQISKDTTPVLPQIPGYSRPEEAVAGQDMSPPVLFLFESSNP